MRRPRADAERNREKLLEATSALVKEGQSELSLAAVAERAGVGIGTLYRHFHNRDALLAALYRNEVERLEAAAANVGEGVVAARGAEDLARPICGAHDGQIRLCRCDEIGDEVGCRDIHAFAQQTRGPRFRRCSMQPPMPGLVRCDAQAEDILIAVAAQVSASLTGRARKNVASGCLA